MDVLHFSQNAPGKLIPTIKGQHAFLPDPLPPNLEFDMQMAAMVGQADNALGRLAGAVQALPNAEMLIGPFLTREAVSSSRIEGTVATEEDVLMFQADPTRPPRTEDVRETANYQAAMRFGMSRLGELPLSLRLLREIHERLLKGVRGAEERPGEVRDVQNWISGPTPEIENARYVPPPVPEINAALGKLEVFMQPRAEYMPFLVKLALVHYQFEAIHPFRDGNGRIGRLLIALMLVERGALPSPVLYLSVYFERNRNAYYDYLLRVSQKAEWRNWILFFLNSISIQSADALSRASNLLYLRQQYREKLQVAQRSARLLRLVDFLFQFPAVNISMAAKLLQISVVAASKNIFKLVNAGILIEVTGRKTHRTFLARGIVDAITEPLPRPSIETTPLTT